MLVNLNLNQLILLLKTVHWRCFQFFNGINPIQDEAVWEGGGKKALPTSFLSVTSTDVEFGRQNFLNFSFNPFAWLVQNSKFVLSANPKLLSLNQDWPSKKAIFLIKSL